MVIFGTWLCLLCLTELQIRIARFTFRLKIFVLANFPFKSQVFNFDEQISAVSNPQIFIEFFLTHNKFILDFLLIFFLTYGLLDIL